MQRHVDYQSVLLFSLGVSELNVDEVVNYKKNIRKNSFRNFVVHSSAIIVNRTSGINLTHIDCLIDSSLIF